MGRQPDFDRIEPLDPRKLESAQKVMDGKTKPVGSLGKLEEIAVRYAAIREGVDDGPLRKRVYTFAADHGVTEEGVSAYPASVTPQMVMNFINGGAAVNVLAGVAGAEVVIVDVGVNADFGDLPGLRRMKIAKGTANFLKSPAMTDEEAVGSIETGMALAEECHRDGIHLVGTGDMGIGNTTASAALLSALLNLDPGEIAGRGTGLDDRGVSRKVSVIRQALQIHKERLGTPIGVLESVGGFEIGAIAGLLLGLALHRIPGIVDGFISTASAVLAMKIQPGVADYLFFSHLSGEQGHARVFREIGVEPILDLRMRLGEGTGAVLAMPVIESAVEVYRKMATFESAGVDRKSPE
jgi:nicotinate-nucleotide--dimethylbenzimidazole phosphoribosyltransferase